MYEQNPATTKLVVTKKKQTKIGRKVRQNLATTTSVVATQNITKGTIKTLPQHTQLRTKVATYATKNCDL